MPWDKPPGRRASDSWALARYFCTVAGLMANWDSWGRSMVISHRQLDDSGVNRRGKQVEAPIRGVELPGRRDRTARRLPVPGGRRCETSADPRRRPPGLVAATLAGRRTSGAPVRGGLAPVGTISTQRGCTGAGASRGLQNRLRGPDEGSLVGSIPIHPRQISIQKLYRPSLTLSQRCC